MIHHLSITHGQTAVIRDALKNITDLERKTGCDVIRLSYKLESFAKEYTKALGYKVVDESEWESYIKSLL